LGANANDYKNIARVLGMGEDLIKYVFSSNKRTAVIDTKGKVSGYYIL
jgi:hypothetical protein